MAFPTQPSFVVHSRGWDANLLQHPVPRFLHAHEDVFDAKDLEGCKPFYASDMTHTKSNGQTFSGEAAVAALRGDCSLFAGYFHEPVFCSISETGDSYRLIGWAEMFVDLPGGGEKKYTDLQGREWECLAFWSFIYDVVKGGGSSRLPGQDVANACGPNHHLGEAIKRGIVPVEALTS
ncbi:hypothetical protein B0T14DRAFT_333617 [Immersiella caudata]|uniref:SnoaL-like domain-containing protein n=1 Tax=Immersiella caudata TaxID=314043 RepID=A0AA39WB76_9PEZI|nr:hypothetical protein B0T14DRAFT_333617 [Immersiella caudata]